MSTELVLNVVNKLGKLRGKANNITLYSLAPSVINEKSFQRTVILKHPVLEEAIPKIEDTMVFENREAFSAIPNIILKNGYAYVSTKTQEEYAQAILPDWVDVYTEENPKPIRLPWQHAVSVKNPDLSEAKVTIEDIPNDITIEGNSLCDGKVYAMYPEQSVQNEEYFAGKIGKVSWIVKHTDDLFVEYCNGEIDVIHQSSLDMSLPIASAIVLAKVEVEVDTGASGDGGGELKSIEILSNKNNYIDVYIEMDNIMRIENLPNGLIYENNHVKGTPNQSGLFISTIIIGTPIAGITAKYTMRFKIPVFERLL